MENQYKTSGKFDGSQGIDLPNSTTVMVLGIGSLVGLLCSGLPGLIMAIIALVLASGDKKLYLRNPAHFTPGSVSNMRTGKTCALISLILCVIFIFVIIAVITFVGFQWIKDIHF
ncbi:MAG: CCC motif membrane protein [Chitinophagaceae bacterium]